MGFNTLKSRLSEYDSRFNNISPTSILGTFISQIGNEIDNLKTLTENADNIKYDILNAYGQELDYIAELYNIQRQVITQHDENVVIPNAVSIFVKDRTTSILSVLQNIYGDQSNFPDELYVSDEQNTFKLLVNFSTSNQLNTIAFIQPQQIEEYNFNQTYQGSKLSFVYDSDILNEYLEAEMLINISELISYESDEQLKLRIQTKFQQEPEPTQSWIEQETYKAVPEARYILVQNFQRGLQTVDVIIFPNVANIYDDNQNLITTFDIAQTAADALKYTLPLGVDVYFTEATQKKLNFEITVVNANEQDQDNITTALKQIIINYLNDIDVGVQSTISTQQIHRFVQTEIIQSGYPVVLQTFTIKDTAGQELTSIDISEHEYPVLNELTAIWA